ncbi:MAG: sigma-70 family RNA polymerase sigma factor [Nanoarchaeota archaeon]|nr:sigma-70 family RNA polymerase sigma factor [Nanoarchaeota archaeon]
MKESELITQAKKGDSEAFGTLYDTYMPAIYRFVLFRVGTKSDAEDITHQVFLKAWKSIRKYRDEGHPFGSWLYRIAQNTIIDYYRSTRAHRDIDTLPEDALSETPGFEENVDQHLQAELVHLAIRELDDTSQSVLLMKFVNDLSNKEISSVLQKSEGAVRVIQHRALKQLKTILEKHDKRSNNQTSHEV